MTEPAFNGGEHQLTREQPTGPDLTTLDTLAEDVAYAVLVGGDIVAPFTRLITALAAVEEVSPAIRTVATTLYCTLGQRAFVLAQQVRRPLAAALLLSEYLLSPGSDPADKGSVALASE